MPARDSPDAITSLATPALLDLLAPVAVKDPSFANWGRTFLCRPHALFEPRTTYECQLVIELARRQHRVVRAVGVGHSPSDVACTKDIMLRTTRLDRVLHVDTENKTVTAEAGVTLIELHAALTAHGLAMRNLGSISDQTLAGIIATSTHGSGVHFPIISAHVRALTLLTAANEILHCSPECRPDLFEATICGLGLTGLILTITLEVEDRFRLMDRQWMVPFAELVPPEESEEQVPPPGSIHALKAVGEHVRFWWYPTLDEVRVSVCDRTKEPKTPPAPLPAALLAPLAFHAVQLLLLAGVWARALGVWVGGWSAWLSGGSWGSGWRSRRAEGDAWGEKAPLLGSWRHSAAGDVDSSTTIATTAATAQASDAAQPTPAHPPLTALACALDASAARFAVWLAGRTSTTVDEGWRVFNIECRYLQHTTEYAIPSALTIPCLRALHAFFATPAARALTVHFPLEVRFSRGDGVWLSPSNGGETCWIGVVVFKPYNRPVAYRRLFAQFEAILAAHGGRPHWAKAHHLRPRDVRRMYGDGYDRFVEVLRTVDPEGRWRNEYVRRHVWRGDRVGGAPRAGQGRLEGHDQSVREVDGDDRALEEDDEEDEEVGERVFKVRR